MTASHILVLAIAVPLFVYGIIRLARLLATGIAEQEQDGRRNIGRQGAGCARLRRHGASWDRWASR